ncbi:MAG TPA: UDP-N-acetylmuramoyl-L-alanyl-D-glutamate--2,6-diaminopimelate ligase [Burkholderiaceae bacterium]|nr:UDP-N-acetylmuramoyl-L-alanyl-D-glutamate--2,6-diaminopimelate ligase [Burkholderiaceae bacterium]
MNASMQVSSARETTAWLRGQAGRDPHVDLHLDSRCVRRGDIFVAVAGGRFDGRRFIADAFGRGARAVLADDDDWPVDAPSAQAPMLRVRGLRAALGSIAADYYHRPSEHMLSVGVTGTNGKTSCSHWIAQILSRTGRRCAVIGTVGVGFPGALRSSELTTPDAVSLQRELQGLLKSGAQAVAMEVSSIGLAQHRVDGMHFDVALFTNLTRDHLDIHGTMDHYEGAKALLFEWQGLQRTVINLDDEAGRRFAARACARGVEVIGYSAGGDSSPRPVAPRLQAKTVRATADGLAFDLECDGRAHRVEVPLVGHYNVANLLGVVGVALACGIDADGAMAILPQLVPPPGRMQRVAVPAQPLVVVDYAHTPDALAQALAAVRPLVCARGGRLWVVFGAGGDRDPGKRSPMGAAAATAADVVVITSDNPRTEDPRAIISQVAGGATGAPRLMAEPDRARAIERAVRDADPSDVILIAGKGHEDYQIVGSERRHFSDVEQAQQALARRTEAA